MISLGYFFDRLKDVKAGDVLSVFPMLVALIVSPLYKKKNANTWLICEEFNEARDNGYWFFRKMRENHPEQRCVYAINKKSVDYQKVAGLGEIIQYGGIKHWIYYFTCAHTISSQKGGKPNAPICAFVELNRWYNCHAIFLQHGVIINDVRWLYADRSRFDMFVTSAVPETKFIQDRFGYPDGVVQQCGLARFDNLHDCHVKKNRIVIMPTWRYWFNLKSKEQEGLDSDFMQSHYLRAWKELLESNKLAEIIQRYNLEVIFYPHRNMQRHLEDMRNVIHTPVTFASWEEWDIQELMKSSTAMITDYSSVFFDMVYMKRPVMFYQFDLDEFRKGQYKEGWFDYQNNPFGDSFLKCDDLLYEFEKLAAGGFSVDEDYLASHIKYFPYYDDNNCERIYESIKRCEKRQYGR